MKASETKVEDFLSRNKTQFVIPIYQRNYDWREGHCQQLLDDIIAVGKSDTQSVAVRTRAAGDEGVHLFTDYLARAKTEAATRALGKK